MTKPRPRERLNGDDPEPTPRRRLARDWGPTPTPKREQAPRRIVRDPPANGSDSDNPPRQYANGESNLPSYPLSNLVTDGTIRGRGRPPGTPNLIPRKITGAFVEAIERLGFDGNGKDGATGYFMRACSEQPAAALAFASRLLPRQVVTTPDPESALMQFLEAARARLQIEKAKTIDAPSTRILGAVPRRNGGGT